MRIVIETDPTETPRVATTTTDGSATAAGAGLSAGSADPAYDADPAERAAPLDAGGPPEWLTAAIGRAMSESDQAFGVAPDAGPALAGLDGGAGPAA